MGIGLALAVALALFAGAHLGLVVGLARKGARWRVRAAISVLVMPLAPWWGWEAGLRRTTIVWGAALALYAVGVVVTMR
jgi:hypothetical protein